MEVVVVVEGGVRASTSLTKPYEGPKQKNSVSVVPSSAVVTSVPRYVVTSMSLFGIIISSNVCVTRISDRMMLQCRKKGC